MPPPPCPPPSMDSQPQTPDFPLECSPPHFSYDLHSESSGTSGSNSFGVFTNFGAFPDASPRLGAFDTLTVGTLNTLPNDSSDSFSTPHLYSQSRSGPGSSSIPHSFGSATNDSAARHSTTLQENLAIPPLLTLSSANIIPESGVVSHQTLSGDDADSLGTNGKVSSTTRGQRQVRESGRRASTKSPQSASRPQGYNVGERDRASTHQMTTDADADVIDAGPGSVEMEAGVSSANLSQRRAVDTKQQRIEAEQRRRDDLRDGYTRLKSTLPNTNLKSSKVTLLDRAITYIHHLESSQASLHSRLSKVESDLTSQRSMNETLVRTITEPNGGQAAANAQTPPSAESSISSSEPPSPGRK